MSEALQIHEAVETFRRQSDGQVVLVLQGGGALGAFQVGVYQALHEAGVEPDWIIGTSIGAINAAMIVGNARENRLRVLDQFWRGLQRPDPWAAIPAWTGVPDALSSWATLAGGVPGFFHPNLPAFLGDHVHLGVERAGYYSTVPLRETVTRLVDFERLAAGPPRLTVGAAHVRSSTMRYFDTREMTLTPDHIMASAALPPGFPAVRIDGDLYWDGGVLSNTPSEVVFDDSPRRTSLIFAVQLWNPDGLEPGTMAEVLHRLKDVQYSSRIASQIARQRQMHQLRHVINQLVEHVPREARGSACVKELASYGCHTRMHVVRLRAPRLDGESHTKDVDFSARALHMRREAGYEATTRALSQAQWEGDHDPLAAVVIHEPSLEGTTPE